MKTLKIICFLLLTFNVENTFAQWTYKDFKPLKKMVGDWSYETWQQVNDSTLEGKFLVTYKADPDANQTMQLVYSNNEIICNISISNKNGGIPVSYKLKEIEGQTYYFENEEITLGITAVKYNLKGKSDKWTFSIATLTEKGLETRLFPFIQKRR